MNDLTNLKVKSAVILHENGMSIKDISELFNISATRVYQLLKIDKRKKANEARKSLIRNKNKNK